MDTPTACRKDTGHKDWTRLFPASSRPSHLYPERCHMYVDYFLFAPDM